MLTAAAIVVAFVLGVVVGAVALVFLEGFPT